MAEKESGKTEIESISWADQDEAPREDETAVDLSRFGGEDTRADDDFYGTEEDQPDGHFGGEHDREEAQHLEHDDQDYEYTEPAEDPPFYKRKWFVFVVVAFLVISGFGFGIYKAMQRKAGKSLLAEQQLLQPQNQQSVDTGLPMIVEDSPPQPVQQEKTVAPSVAPTPTQEEQSPAGGVLNQQNTVAAASVAPESDPAAAGNGKDLKAYLDHHVAGLRAMIDANEKKHRAEYKEMTAQIARLSSELNKRQLHSASSAPAAAVVVPPAPQAMSGYRLQSIVPDRAWVVLPDESVKAVVVGTVLPGGLRVEKILAQEQQVVTNKGFIK